MKTLNLFLLLGLMSLTTVLSAQFYTNGTDRIYTWDKVGIDITTPAYDLTVKTQMASINSDGYLRTLISTTGNSGQGGFLETYGYGRTNIRLSTLSGYMGNGYISVNDNSGTHQAGVYVNSFGRGVVFGDIKNFRMDHPTQSDKEIWYASLEGPEAAAYERGQATLVNGEVFVPFSEHFRLVINSNDMTVMMTPNSADTYGLAVVEKTDKGFKVKELKDGTGNFSFDWEVKAIRKGYEDFQVIRDKDAEKPAEESDLKEDPKGEKTNSFGNATGKSNLSLDVARLSQNQPNPAVDFTLIPVYVADDIQNATLNVYTGTGRLVESISVLDRGESKIEVPLDNYASGNYYYSLEADGAISKTKMLTVAE